MTDNKVLQTTKEFQDLYREYEKSDDFNSLTILGWLKKHKYAIVKQGDKPNQQSPTGEGITEAALLSVIISEMTYFNKDEAERCAKAIMEKIAPLQEEVKRLREEMEKMKDEHEQTIFKWIQASNINNRAANEQISQLQSEIQRLTKENDSLKNDKV